MTSRFTVAMVFSLLAAPVMTQGADGILITQRATSGGDVLTIRMQIQTTPMRTDIASASGPSQVTIFDADKQVLYSIDPVGKTFMEITKADVDRMSGFVLGAMAQMEQQLEKMPAAQRAQMEAMIKSRGGATPALQYARTGSGTVGRWRCDMYDMMRDGRKMGEACTVNPATLGFGATDFDVMRRLRELSSAMAAPMADQLAGRPIADDIGFAVRTTMESDGRTTTMDVIDVSRETFPDSLFAVPADFKRQDFMGMGGRGIDQRR